MNLETSLALSGCGCCLSQEIYMDVCMCTCNCTRDDGTRGWIDPSTSNVSDTPTYIDMKASWKFYIQQIGISILFISTEHLKLTYRVRLKPLNPFIER